MLKRSFSRSVPFIILSWVYMMRSFSVSRDTFKFIGITEEIFPIVLILLASFILGDKTEIELALVNGTPTSKLFFSKLIPIMVYTVIPIEIFLFIMPFKTDAEVDVTHVLKDQPIPQYVPENYAFYVAISILVTLIFFFAIFSLIRVITRNCYLAIFLNFAVGVGFDHFRAMILSNNVPLTTCLFDPLLGTYFIGNEVPGVYAEKYTELASMANVWTHNRLLIIGASALIFLITYLILRREKLHTGIGE